MPEPHAHPDLTRLLQSWRDGESAAIGQVFVLAYDEPKRIAAQRLRQSRLLWEPTSVGDLSRGRREKIAAEAAPTGCRHSALVGADSVGDLFQRPRGKDRG